jgi:hypothetical protein
MMRMKRFILSGCWWNCLQKDFVLMRVREKCLHVREICGESDTYACVSTSCHLAEKSADKMPVTWCGRISVGVCICQI